MTVTTAAPEARYTRGRDAIAELSGYFFEDLEIGMTMAYARTIGAADLVLFTGISGDTSPMHLNE